MGHVQRKAASTQKFPKGSWQARYIDHEGKHHTKSFATKREADRHLAQVTTDLAMGAYIDPQRANLRFSELARRWEEAPRPNVKPGTLLGYQALLRNHVLPYFGSHPVSSIKRSSIKAWVANCLSHDVGVGVIRNAYRNVLKPILDLAVEDELIRANPAQGFKLNLPKAEREEMLFLTADEVYRLAQAIDKPYDVLILFAAYTGLRAGEIGALRVKHLDLLRRKVSVEESVTELPMSVTNSSQHRTSNLLYQRPKTDASRRTVTLPKFLSDALAAHLHAHPLAVSPFGQTQPLDPETLVFMTARGMPLRHGNFVTRFFKPAVRACLPPNKHGLRFHDLRHTCASLLINPPISANPKAVMAQLGHTSIQITFDRYGHLYDDVALDIAARLDSTFMKAQQQVDQVRDGPHPSSPTRRPPTTDHGSVLRRLASADENY